MNQSMMRALLAAGALIALLGVAAAQQSPAPAAPAEQPADQPGNDASAPDLSPEEAAATANDAEAAARAGEGAAAGDPEGPTGEAVTDDMRATMRRFVPSEQISEDSSVSFPNDI